MPTPRLLHRLRLYSHLVLLIFCIKSFKMFHIMKQTATNSEAVSERLLEQHDNGWGIYDTGGEFRIKHMNLTRPHSTYTSIVTAVSYFKDADSWTVPNQEVAE